jgi:hypothetical protein
MHERDKPRSEEKIVSGNCFPKENKTERYRASRQLFPMRHDEGCEGGGARETKDQNQSRDMGCRREGKRSSRQG